MAAEFSVGGLLRTRDHVPLLLRGKEASVAPGGEGAPSLGGRGFEQLGVRVRWAQLTGAAVGVRPFFLCGPLRQHPGGRTVLCGCLALLYNKLPLVFIPTS